ncbi:ferredoxin [Nocardioides sp. CFH 31398]|uniref:ferredoxin n=1 Tax=Nocardioides sp. CFH 31398 TaxID=2919579 RepID=UPI001F0519A8|nr:ferredoxin [Nocardioides sp. CFH 31398]MCH1867686.1 ferredoxin [Nocardioides sp. CFH 31398]
MRIRFDEDRCASTGMCESVAPDVFSIGDDGWLHVLDESPDESRRAEIAEACDACPTGALTLEG